MINRDILFSLNSIVPAPLDLLAEDIYPNKPKEKRERMIQSNIGQIKMLDWRVTNPGLNGYLLSERHLNLLRKAFCGEITIPEDEIIKLVGPFTPDNVRKIIAMLIDN